MSVVNLIYLTTRLLKGTLMLRINISFIYFVQILPQEDFLSAQHILQEITFKLKGHRRSLLCL